MIPFNKLCISAIKLTPVAVAQQTTAEQTFTIQGLQTTDIILSINKPTAQAGLGIVGARISAANTLAITYVNAPAGGNITPTAEIYTLVFLRPDMLAMAGVQFNNA